MKISFLIPCVNRHVPFLKNIKEMLDISTRKPDEVIVHISSCNNDIDCNYVNDLFSNNGYEFKFKASEEIRNAGVNRNNLAEDSTGELLIYQDADDLFHHQRIELVEKSFELEDIMHLCHGYHYIKNPKEKIHLENIDFDPKKIYSLQRHYDAIFPNKECHYDNSIKDFGTFQNKKDITCNKSNPAHNGAICIRKEVIEKIKWKTRRSDIKIAEDQDFNFECFYHFKKSYILLEKLYYYMYGNNTAGGSF